MLQPASAPPWGQRKDVYGQAEAGRGMPLLFCNVPGTVYISHLLLITVSKADMMIPSQTRTPAQRSPEEQSQHSTPGLSLSKTMHDLLA